MSARRRYTTSVKNTVVSRDSGDSFMRQPHARALAARRCLFTVAVLLSPSPTSAPLASPLAVAVLLSPMLADARLPSPLAVRCCCRR
jgi:hypothetical protein